MAPDPMNSSDRTPQAHARFVELDSLRGLAAITVMFGHFCGVWQGDGHASSKLGGYLAALLTTNAGNAVILFFVLSGFVLSLPAVEGRPQSYLTYVIRRIFRIYIPYLSVLALAVCGVLLLHGRIALSGGAIVDWSEPLDWRLVWQHVLFLGNYDADKLDLPVWSLVYEMRISLFFPPMCAVLLRMRSRWLLVIAPLLTCAILVASKLPFEGWGWASTTVQFTAFFILGIYLARERNHLIAWLSRKSRSARIAVGVGCVLFYCFAELQIEKLTGPHSPWRFILLAQWLTALGAAGLMVCSMQSRLVKRILNTSPLRWLGEMSYSVYLLHCVVLLSSLHLMYGKIPLWAILVLSGSVTILLSRVWYRMVEVPSIRTGRRLSNLNWRAPSEAALSKAQ